jgi:hypothetical protein
MADKHKSQVEQNALRLAQWLMQNGAEFEQQGIYEDKLASAAGLMDKDVKEAVDYLENREEVVRIPKALTTPPLFLLKPGRGWPDVQEEVLKKKASG